MKTGARATRTAIRCLCLLLAAAAVAQPSLEERTARLEQLKAELLAQESRLDAYAPEIAETTLELGNLYVDMGFYDAALQSYERAIGVEKINRGLYSPDLVPLYNLMFDTLVKAGRTEDAMALTVQLEWLVENGFDPADPATVPVLERLALIHLAAAEQAIDSQPLVHLQQSFELARRAADLSIDSDDQFNALQIGSLTGSRMLGLLNEIERDIRFSRNSDTRSLCTLIASPAIESVCGRPPTTTTSFTTTLASSSLLYCPETGVSTNLYGEREGYNFDHVANYVARCQNSFEEQVGELNQRLRDETERSDELADLLRGADFALLRGDRELAERRYLRARESAIESGQELSPLISPIHTADFIGEMPSLRRGSDPQGTVRLTLDISARGRASDIVLEADPDAETPLSDEQLTQINRRVRGTLFRPAVGAEGLEEIRAVSCVWDVGQDRCAETPVL